MTVAERIRDATDKIYLRMRDPRAWEAQSSETASLESLRGHRNALLHTFRKSGEAVPTPVWFGLADGKLYFRTYANPRVLIGPCDVRGKPLGPMLEARGRPLAEDEETVAEQAIRRNHGLFRRLYLAGFSGRVPDTYVEVIPV
jgi:PPOX class probable F420-dependent enzyme